MKTNTNAWMLSSFFMTGLLVGFSIGRFITPGTIIQPSTSVQIKNTDSTNQIANNNAGQIGATAINTPSIKLDYTGIKISQTADKHWALGDAKAPVKIEEYSDFQCPFCHKYFTESFSQIFENYIKTGKVYYVYYNYPLSIHPDAPGAAKAAACAGDQNQFWQMHHELFDTQNSWSGSGNAIQLFKNSAKKLGLNSAEFDPCLDSTKYNSLITNDTKKGNQNGVSGTPTFFINGKKIVGALPYTSIQSAIDAALLQ